MLIELKIWQVKQVNQIIFHEEIRGEELKKKLAIRRLTVI
uniref:Uncharacterized protein n=1 Tax=Anguilla anguilla TaxID=7936 RepID=A0A0E9R932_ANGAN